MCLILDANCFGDALATPPNPKYVPVIEWLTSRAAVGLVVFGGSKFRREIANSEKARRWFLALERAGRAKSIDDGQVDAEERALKNSGACCSDDEHLVALARKSGARVICTQDQALSRDVRDRQLLARPRGRVYRRANHAHLLDHHRGCQRPPRR